MSETMVLNEDDVMELLAFLVSAARIQLDEPPYYAPMRLLSAAERLSLLAINRASPEGRQALEEIKTQILQIERGRRLSERPEDVPRLDALCRTVAQHLVNHTGLARRSP
ncbi:MAG: DUF6092 family protein [Chloroflexi bacterium]|nr:DUF6092 family protein [Chloroflexota bacterium]